MNGVFNHTKSTRSSCFSSYSFIHSLFLTAVMTTKSLSEIVERFGLLLFLINENIKDEFACRNLLSDVDNVIAENDQDAAPYLVGLIMSKILNPKEDSEVKAMMFLVITNALKKSGDLYGQIFACHFKFIDPEVFVKLTNDRLFKIKFVVSEWKAFKDIFDVAVTNELLARITEQLEEAQRKEPIIHNKASGFQRARYYQAEIQHAHLNPLLIPDVVRNMRRHHHQQEGEMFGKKRHHGSTSDYMEDRETKVIVQFSLLNILTILVTLFLPDTIAKSFRPYASGTVQPLDEPERWSEARPFFVIFHKYSRPRRRLRHGRASEHGAF
jgi:hypothetical protein